MDSETLSGFQDRLEDCRSLIHEATDFIGEIARHADPTDLNRETCDDGRAEAQETNIAQGLSRRALERFE